MQTVGGRILVIVGLVAQVILGLWGFIVELSIVYDVLGGIGVVAGLIFFPLTFFLAPFYALLADGNWFPLLLIYGGAVPGRVLMSIGESMLEREASLAAAD